MKSVIVMNSVEAQERIPKISFGVKLSLGYILRYLKKGFDQSRLSSLNWDFLEDFFFYGSRYKNELGSIERVIFASSCYFYLSTSKHSLRNTQFWGFQCTALVRTSVGSSAIEVLTSAVYWKFRNCVFLSPCVEVLYFYKPRCGYFKKCVRIWEKITLYRSQFLKYSRF